MANKVFGSDYTNTTAPLPAWTITVNDGTGFKDVSLGDLLASVTHNSSAKSAPVGADKVGIIDSQASNVLKTATWDLVKSLWTELNESWSYASATTITVPTDATTRFQVGDCIRLKQGGAYKYFNIVSLTSTVLTVFAGSDFSVANSAITDIAYSRGANPFGFPASFNWSPNWNGTLTLGNGILNAKVRVHERFVSGYISLEWAAVPTTTINSALTFTTPTPHIAYNNPASSGSRYIPLGAAGLIDWATALYMGEAVLNLTNTVDVRVINASGTYAVWSGVTSTVPFTWGASDILTVEFTYMLG